MYSMGKRIMIMVKKMIILVKTKNIGFLFKLTPYSCVLLCCFLFFLPIFYIVLLLIVIIRAKPKSITTANMMTATLEPTPILFGPFAANE